MWIRLNLFDKRMGKDAPTSQHNLTHRLAEAGNLQLAVAERTLFDYFAKLTALLLASEESICL